ncbi:MAG: response regulator [Planctomycetota bacterium]|jgi:CheY-like chemotaxis protein
MQPRNVLVAATDVRLLQALRVRLQSEGYTVTLAQNAHQVLERAAHARPDVLLHADLDVPSELASIPAVAMDGITDANRLIVALREAVGDAVRAPERR